MIKVNIATIIADQVKMLFTALTANVNAETLLSVVVFEGYVVVHMGNSYPELLI